VNGEVVFGDVDKGSEYNLVGVPYRYPSGLPLTPEQAVATVAQSTGRRASQVPVAFNQLDDRGLGQFPLCASWKVEVDQPVSVTIVATGQGLSTREFFVKNIPACFSPTIALYAAAADQPRSRWIAVPNPESRTVNDSVLVSLSGPVMFHRVTVQR